MSEYRAFKIEKTEEMPGDFRWIVYGLYRPWPFGRWAYLGSCRDEDRARKLVAETATYPAVRHAGYFHADGSKDYGGIW